MRLRRPIIVSAWPLHTLGPSRCPSLEADLQGADGYQDDVCLRRRNFSRSRIVRFGWGIVVSIWLRMEDIEDAGARQGPVVEKEGDVEKGGPREDVESFDGSAYSKAGSVWTIVGCVSFHFLS